jgi:hypothetical protein
MALVLELALDRCRKYLEARYIMLRFSMVLNSLLIIFLLINEYDQIAFAKPVLVTSNAVEIQKKLLAAADEMLETLDVSYVYGGTQVGSEAQCASCNQCLENKSPAPKERVKKCPDCVSCSLDCSHFTKMVYERAGLKYPYLTTAQMLDLPDDVLLAKYGLVSIKPDATISIPGDLMVYSGHVVILEKITKIEGDKVWADIIHATGGSDLKGPGQGIQRERNARVDYYRNHLVRIIRHKLMGYSSKVNQSHVVRPTRMGGVDLNKLRKIERQD